MNCDKALNIIYEGDTPPFAERLVLAFHTLLCERCAGALRRYECARNLLKTGFFPLSPDFEDTVMADIYAQSGADETDDAPDTTGGFSIRGWVIAGFAVIVSLTLSFFGRDFLSITALHGSAFLIPLGIMTGIFITAYGLLFIGSHLRELSHRFGLHHF
jgi:hypothetical protein